jgi:hypothetical protein
LLQAFEDGEWIGRSLQSLSAQAIQFVRRVNCAADWLRRLTLADRMSRKQRDCEQELVLDEIERIETIACHHQPLIMALGRPGARLGPDQMQRQGRVQFELKIAQTALTE